MSRGTSERRQNRDHAQRESAIRLREQGYSYSEIAEQLGITKKQAQSKARAADSGQNDG